LADLQAWCVSEGLAMPVEAIERSERLKPEDMTAFLQRLLPAVEAIERLERSQTEAIAQGIRQALTEFRASTPLERSGTSSMLSQAPRPDREDIITHIRQAKDAGGKSFQQIANELNAEGIATFSGKGVWQKGSVERFYKGH
jgi:Recombinase